MTVLRVMVSGVDLGDEWIALGRVHGGGVAKSAGVYVEHGCPVPEHLTGVFDRLVWAGLVGVGEGDPIWGLQRLSLTEAGRARYAQWGERKAALPVPPPEHGTSWLIPPGGPPGTGS